MRTCSTAVIFISILACGCSLQDKHFRISPQFSVNLAVPSEEWADSDTFTSAEQAVFEQFGKPNFIRIWWDENGRIKTYLEVDRDISSRLYREKEKSWIYKNDEKEIIFPDANNFEVLPLSPKLKILCQYGDPENRKINEEVSTSKQVEVWQYYTLGKIFTFWDNILVKEQTVPRLGTKIKT